MEIKDLFIQYLSSVHAIAPEETASLLYTNSEDGEASIKDDALDTLLNMHSDKITQVKKVATDKYNEGHKKGKQESLSKFENDLKTAYAYTGDAQGLELIKNIMAQEMSNNTSASPKLGADQVIQSQHYLDMLEAKEAEKNAAVQQLQHELQSLSSGIQRKEIFSNVSDQALSIFKTLHPNLPADDNVAQNQVKSLLLSPLNDYDFEVNGEQVLISKEGKLLDDGHGNPKSLDKLVEDIAKRNFTFQVASGRQSGSGTNDATAEINPYVNQERKWTGKLPNSLDGLRELKSQMSREEYYEVTKKFNEKTELKTA